MDMESKQIGKKKYIRCCNVMLSIKPKFVDMILNGTKTYEFRRKIFSSYMDYVYMYSTSPEQIVRGYFLIDKIIQDDKNALWSKTESGAGITRDEYDDYFKGTDTCYAIKIGKIWKFDDIRTLKHYRINHPPQSFTYIW